MKKEKKAHDLQNNFKHSKINVTGVAESEEGQVRDKKYLRNKLLSSKLENIINPQTKKHHKPHRKSTYKK